MQKFTPIFDEVCQHTGLVPAAVYGVVWRYCQMSEHVCYTTLETIGLQAGVSKRTAIRALALLESQGWIVDQTPDNRNVPHVYQVTNRLPHTRTAPPAATPAVTDSQPATADNPPAAPDCPSGDDSLSPQAVTPGQLAVTDSHPSRDSLSSPVVNPGSPVVSPGHPLVNHSHPAVPDGHPGGDNLSSPAVTHSHLNQTPQRDSLKDESGIDPPEEEEVSIPEWQQVVKMLEIHFGSHNQYVACLPALRPLSFDGAVLTVLAPNSYQTELLNSRIARSASTILCGILGQPGMLVTFVAEESRQSSVVEESLQSSVVSFQLSKETH